MQEHGSITPLDAMLDLGCYRLAARIHEIKEQHEIITTMRKVQNRYGETTQIAEYKIQ